MTSKRMHAVSAGVLVVAALGLMGCSGHDKPKVASVSGANSSTSGNTHAASDNGRPRHRIDETAADADRIIEPWRKCMKDNGADVDQMPNNIAGAKQWSKDHSRAGDACTKLLPLPAWGLDKANPEYRDNVHQWVKCMKDKGLNVIETPDDDESPWRFAGSSQTEPAGQDVEHDCEVATLGKTDK